MNKISGFKLTVHSFIAVQFLLIIVTLELILAEKVSTVLKENDKSSESTVIDAEENMLKGKTNFTITSRRSQSVTFRRDPTDTKLYTFINNVIDRNENATPRVLAGIKKLKDIINKEKKILVEETEVEITYRLYNQNLPHGEYINYKGETAHTNWIRGSQAVFIIHGWMQSGEKDILSEFFVKTSILPAFPTSLIIKDAYIESNRRENVIIVNWNAFSKKCYIVSSFDTRLVGEAVAHMIIYLKSQHLINYNQVKIVGFSLGAHIAGVVGHYIHEKLGIKIGEITGLDPAGPLFESWDTLDYHLDQHDAKFVQVIHCNMGRLFWPLWDPHFGSMRSAAHVNFYPNGGVDQPNCGLLPIIKSGCSHLRCGELYASTVRGTSYKGCLCDAAYPTRRKRCFTCKCQGPSMGDLCPRNATGGYCVKAIPRMLFE